MATRHWTIDGLSFALPEEMLTPGIARMCDKGWYEAEERRALSAHLKQGDRVLEIGGGAGLLASAAARVAGPEAVTTVEANPAMLPVIRANLEANGFGAVTLRHGAVLAEAAPGARAELHVPGAFWAAGIAAPRAEARPVDCPALDFGTLVHEQSPDVLIVDVEGAEADFFAAPLPEALRLIVLELHPALYSRKTVARIFDRLAAQGLAYDPAGSSGAVVCFTRV